MKTKMMRRIEDAVSGKIAYEDLSMKEIRKLERLIFRAIARKFGPNVAPSTLTRH